MRGNEALEIEFVHSGDADQENAIGLLRTLSGTVRASRSEPSEACRQPADEGAAPNDFVDHQDPRFFDNAPIRRALSERFVTGRLHALRIGYAASQRPRSVRALASKMNFL
jgi:hypothetical protein